MTMPNTPIGPKNTEIEKPVVERLLLKLVCFLGGHDQHLMPMDQVETEGWMGGGSASALLIFRPA